MDDASFREHVEVLGERWQDALAFAGFDAVVVAAGEPHVYFLDDITAPFRPNPHFAQWFPDADCAHAALLIHPGDRPRLFFHQPDDYWHQPPAVPEWAGRCFDVAAFKDLAELDAALGESLGAFNRTAFIGERAPGNLAAAQHNPTLLLNHVHYYRAYKTPFEVACLAAANDSAIAGHLEARSAFAEGASEFDIHMRYLSAARQTAADLPYSSIVALNEHAGVLHYQHYERLAPAAHRSFLIDAGASAHCYAADVTRTYAAPGQSAFAELVDAVDAAQQALIEDIRTGMPYGDVHEAAHRALGGILASQGIVTCSAEAAFERGLTRTFLPHGVGHLIGLQTHDVGGQQASPEGGRAPPPQAYPALRTTRTIEPEQAFTIEPGLYFIPLLLEEARRSDAGRDIDWQRVSELAPCGGIRIEDNVVVTADGIRNLTREAFTRHA